MFRSPRIVSIALAALVLAGHVYVHAGYLARINGGNLPPDPPRVESSLAPHRVARRLRVMVIDGLGWEPAQQVPQIRSLIERGAARPLLADFPSFTYPALRAMATGRPPLYSGVRINARGPYPPFDTVAREASAAGIPVRADRGHLALFPELLGLSEPWVRGTAAGLLAQSPERTLDWLYFGEVDDAGHAHGGESAQYSAAAARAGVAVQAAWDATDPLRDVLVLVSDHAHRPHGGHGGGEPEAKRALFVAAGAGIVPRLLPPAAMRDVAPTLSALLGIPPPAQSLGQPLADLFGAAPRGPEAALVQDARDEADFTRAASLRLVIAAAALLAFAIFLRGKLSALAPRDFLPVAAYTAIFATLYLLAGFSCSWSIPSSEGSYELNTLAFGAVGAGAAWILSRRLLEETVAFLLLYAPLFVLEQAWIGFEHSRLAGPRLSFFYLLLVTAMFYGGLVQSARLFAHSRPGRRALASYAIALCVLVIAPVLWRLTR